jgi:hypothetical protein
MQGRWIAHQLIRRQGRGDGTLVGLDAVVAANLGGHGSTTCARVSTRHRVMQVAGADATASERPTARRRHRSENGGELRLANTQPPPWKEEQ